LHNGKVEVVKVDLALKSKFVERFEDIEGKDRSRAVEGGWIPPHPEQLPVTFTRWSAHVAVAENNANFVTTVDIDDSDVIRRGPSGTRVAVMAKVACKSEGMEGGPVEEPVPPELGRSVSQSHDVSNKLTYLQAMQRQ
jgi:hypothetical protein